MSGYIGTQPVPQATQTRQTFVATSAQTSFATGGYSVGYLDVFLNGVKLQDGVDYTATNGSDIVLTVGAALDDTLEVVAYTAFEVFAKTFTGTTTVETLVVTGTVDGRDVAADGTKLDGIEAGATADQTAAEILTAVKTVDGAASGLDADLLDGLHASSFLQGNQTITLSGDATGSGTTSIVVTVADDSHNHVWGNIDGASVGGLAGPRFTTAAGYIEFGPANTTWAHIYTDRPNFYFNKSLYVLGTPVLTGSGVPSTSASAVGSVGSYAYLQHVTANLKFNAGVTYAGSSLRYSGTLSYSSTTSNGHYMFTGSTAAGGTWRAMGAAQNYYSTKYPATLFLRIS